MTISLIGHQQHTFQAWIQKTGPLGRDMEILASSLQSSSADSRASTHGLQTSRRPLQNKSFRFADN